MRDPSGILLLLLIVPVVIGVEWLKDRRRPADQRWTADSARHWVFGAKHKVPRAIVMAVLLTVVVWMMFR